MAGAPIFDRIESRRTVGRIIREVLKKHGLAPAFDEQELHVERKFIAEPTSERVLSDAILGQMFPQIKGPVELLHYTSADGLVEIARSGELRLYPIRRRIGQGELDAFTKTHKLDGYLHSAAGEPYFKELSDDLFYTSFTDAAAKNELYMWDVFARSQTGARLRLRLAPVKAELRTVLYDSPSRTLLTELNDALAAAGQPGFLPWTISKIGAFYLPSTLLVESEMRLLMKRHDGANNPICRDSAGEYLPIRFFANNDFCRIEVIDVTLGRNADGQTIKAALKGTVFQNVQTLGP